MSCFTFFGNTSRLFKGSLLHIYNYLVAYFGNLLALETS